MSKNIDFPLPRSVTIQNLYEAVLNKFPQLNEEPPASPDAPPAEDEGGENKDNNPPGGGEEGSEADADAVVTQPPSQSRFISIAKGFVSGPPLSLKSALKLKWNDPAVLRRGECPIDRPPLNLRDGSVIVVRGVADFERARAAVRARREAEGPRPISAGAGVAAVRAKSRGKFPSALPPKEKGLKIGGTADGNAPPPPQPTPEKARGLPNVP